MNDRNTLDSNENINNSTVQDDRVIGKQENKDELFSQDSQKILASEDSELDYRKKRREMEHDFIASLPGVSEVLLVKRSSDDVDDAEENLDNDSDSIASEAFLDQWKIAIPEDIDPELLKERVRRFLAKHTENEVKPDDKLAEAISDNEENKQNEISENSSSDEIKDNQSADLLSDLIKTELVENKYEALTKEESENLIKMLLQEDRLERDKNESLAGDEEQSLDGARDVAQDKSDESESASAEIEQLDRDKQWRQKALGADMQNRPWTLFYDPLLKSSYEYKDESVYEMFERSLLKYPDDIAVVDAFSKKTNQQLLNDIYLAANALRQLGVSTGKVVTICMANSIQFVTAFYAIQRLGAIANIVHPLTPPKRLAKSMQKTNSYILFTSERSYSKQMDELRMINLRYVIVSSVYDNFDSKFKNCLRLCHLAMPKLSFSWRKLKDNKRRFGKFIVVNSNKKLSGFELKSELNSDLSLISELIESYPTKDKKEKLDPMHTAVNSMSWKSFMALRSSSALPRIRKNDDNLADRPAIYLNSGGTMDEPKTIVLSSKNINAIAVQAPGIFGREKMRGLKVMAVLPFFHAYGLCMELHAALSNNMTCVLIPQYTAKSYARMLIKEQADILIGVPTFYEAILNNPYLKGQNLSFIKAAFCGGDLLKSKLKKEIDEYFINQHAMIAIREGYGLSEASSLVAITPTFGKRLRSVGLPIADLDVIIADPKTGERIDNAEVGEILLSGPTISSGYLNDDEMNAKAYLEIDGKRYLKTGDLGFFDEDGFLYYVSRKKRIIKVSGISVYPAEVEKTIKEVEGVEDAICVGAPDEYQMSLVKAYVIPTAIPTAIPTEQNAPKEPTEQIESKEQKETNEFSHFEPVPKVEIVTDRSQSDDEKITNDDKITNNEKIIQSLPATEIEQNELQIETDNFEHQEQDSANSLTEPLENDNSASEKKDKNVQTEEKLKNIEIKDRDNIEIIDEEYERYFERLSKNIREHCNDNLIKHAVPRQIIYIDSFPLTSIGKIDIAKLENQLIESLYEDRDNDKSL